MTVLIAGTFAKIHDGHEILIRAAYKLATMNLDKVQIAVATTEYVKKYKTYNSSLPERLVQMEWYLECMYGYNWNDSFDLTFFDSPFDGVEDQNITTIVCSQETLTNVLAFNKLRSARGLEEVNIYCIPLTLNDFGKKLSSTELIENE